STIEHLLGPELLTEYMKHFQEMKQKGRINRLENIAVRKVEIEDAGVSKNEEYLTVLFTANLLDYTIDESTDTVIEGSRTEPVKFAEKWTFARPAGSSDWKLSGIDD
ncbi:MAG: TIM44-like domain-containing protein, partial [Thermodesulfobacteriota bacterium]|nr:TIM44-like domain-containing protein [Thermodesulfobacteriota bacterium]